MYHSHQDTRPRSGRSECVFGVQCAWKSYTIFTRNIHAGKLSGKNRHSKTDLASPFGALAEESPHGRPYQPHRLGAALPYTLYPAPYTLHPTPYTLHPTPSCPREPESRTLRTPPESPPRLRRGLSKLVEESPQGRLAPCLQPHRRGCNPFRALPLRSSPIASRGWVHTASSTGISRKTHT